MSNSNWGNLLFGFSGRINRAKWWLACLVLVILYALMWLTTKASETIGSILALIGLVIVIWISLAAGAKRLHDLNRTAAWLVLFIGAPFVLAIVFFAYAGLAVGAEALAAGVENLDPTVLIGIGLFAIVIGLIKLALIIWIIIWFGCLRGSVGPNQYGPDPLEGRA
ncbi:MAG: DUF805 domain-containing protein [Xanthobacteraceae bacterium]|nr:DUF805 domain-containing protein [Xanthobacteraceae bacterium]